MSNINLKEFFKDYMDYWGEVTSMVEVMGDAGGLIAELRNYMTTSGDYDTDVVAKGLGDLYLSLNTLIEYIGRDKIIAVVTNMAERRIAEMELDKEEKGLSVEWDDEQNKLDAKEGDLG